MHFIESFISFISDYFFMLYNILQKNLQMPILIELKTASISPTKPFWTLISVVQSPESNKNVELRI